MKYLIVKGWLGFGDRLESLKYAVAYALKHGLQIYVDWRDPMWSHGSNDFYTYFKMVNMPVLNSIADLPEDATYYPPYWKGHLDEHISYDFLLAHPNDNLNIPVLDKPFDADVVVYSCIGSRVLYPDSSFFAKVFRVHDQRILTRVRAHLRAYPVSQSWGVHIRGTDRVQDKKRLRSIQSIVIAITGQGGMNQKHMVVVSDDKENAQIWKNFYPESYLVSSFATDSHRGTHNLGAHEISVSKDQLNVDMLVDFFTIAHCPRVYSTIKDSRFAQEVRRLHPVVGQILS
jgi:hypothetical protein